MQQRYDVVQEGSSWSIGTGGPSLRGYRSSHDAVAKAVGLAREAEKDGHVVAVYLWERGGARLVYDTTP